MTQHDSEQNDHTNGQDQAVRWVQYDAPLFVRVEPDEDGWGSEITKVILVATPEHIPLARDDTGQFLVYDENFEPIDNLDADVRIDGLRGAVSVAEDKHRWPREQLVPLTDDWSIGPDPRDDPHYHLTDEELARKYPDPDGEALDPDDAH